MTGRTDQEKKNYDPNKRYTPAQLIRKKCLDCCCFQHKEVKECTLKNCPLWRWRMGKEQKDHLHPNNKLSSSVITK